MKLRQALASSFIVAAFIVCLSSFPHWNIEHIAVSNGACLMEESAHPLPTSVSEEMRVDVELCE